MSTRPFASALATLLTVALVAPSALLLVPQQVQAQGIPVYDNANLITNIKDTVESTITAIKSTLSAALDVTNTAATVAMQVNAYVLQPLAFVLSGNLLKLITAGVIAFVIGKTNGTGVPQFAVDVMQSLQTVSDSRALGFLNQFGRNSNSPFAGSIASSLRNNYLSKTSLAGFWAANMCTLARTSPNVNAFLAGNWSQGGVASWFALTTQVQNNPYSLYANSQDQLAGLIGPGVGGATGARLAQLGWGQGYLSWCGPTDTTVSDLATSQVLTPSATPAGINPGDPCTDKDGNPGIIKTPGSVIAASLNKVLGGQQDQVTRMGNVGPEITGILNNIATVMQTVNFAGDLLGGPNSGGLLGVGGSSGSNSTSRLMQYQATPSLGVTNSTILQNAASISVSGPDMLNRVAQYESAWNTIRSVATTTSATVTNLLNSCSQQASSAQAALTNEINPVLAQAATAAANIAAARALVAKIQSESNAATSADAAAYTADLQTLQTMPPSLLDVSSAQQNTQSLEVPVASPAGSLTVSGGSLVDQLNLINTNAAALQSACAAP